MTSQEYWNQVDEIELKNPDEPLLATIKGGFSALNEIYLKAAMARLPEDEYPEEESESGYSGADDTLRKLWQKRTQLFGKMNEYSNRFHALKTKDERSRNSKEILSIWNDILGVKSKISHYEKHGDMPDEIMEDDNLPENPVELSRKLNSIRARISQKKKQLVDLAGLDKSSPGREGKIEAAEKDLTRLKHLAGLAAERLKTFENG